MVDINAARRFLAAEPAALYAYRTTPGYSTTALFARKGLEAA
ncbi:hypothetical protein [Stenotrophomonas maltophilia]|nr:hypothetical protein [Stenotrophomonas maltophilia]